MTAYTLEGTENLGPKATIGSVVLDYLRALVAAQECAAAIESGKRPSDESLRAMGIDPPAFAEVKLF